MSGTSGLNTGNFTSVNVAYGIGVGVNDNQGTEGQVLVSGGENQPNKWETPVSATMERLTAGDDIVMEKSDGTGAVSFYDGSVAVDISSTNTQDLTLGQGDGIQFTGDGSAGNPKIISTRNDGTTLTNTGGTSGEENAVLRVPNTLTITDSDGTSITYDGSSAKSITINDNDTTYQGSATINIDTSGGLPHTISCIKVPNNLTINGTEGSITYNGSSAETITINDGDTTYQGGTGISIDESGGLPYTINCSNIPNSALANSTISGVSLGGTLANLTIYNNDGTLNTSYNGTSPTSFTLDGDTTYGVVAPITKTSPNGTENIGLDYDTNTLEVPEIGDNSDKLVVKKVPNSLTINGTEGSITYDGSSPETITINDSDTTYQGSTTINITPTTDPTIFQLDCLRVPHALTAGNGITFTPSGTYDGYVARTISVSGDGALDIYKGNITDDYVSRTFNGTSTSWEEINDELRLTFTTPSDVNSVRVEFSYYASISTAMIHYFRVIDTGGGSDPQPFYESIIQGILYRQTTATIEERHNHQFLLRGLTADTTYTINIAIWTTEPASSSREIKFMMGGGVANAGSNPPVSPSHADTYGGMFLKLHIENGSNTDTTPTGFS